MNGSRGLSIPLGKPKLVWSRRSSNHSRCAARLAGPTHRGRSRTNQHIWRALEARAWQRRALTSVAWRELTDLLANLPLQPSAKMASPWSPSSALPHANLFDVHVVVLRGELDIVSARGLTVAPVEIAASTAMRRLPMDFSMCPPDVLIATLRDGAEIRPAVVLPALNGVVHRGDLVPHQGLGLTGDLGLEVLGQRETREFPAARFEPRRIRLLWRPRPVESRPRKTRSSQMLDPRSGRLRMLPGMVSPERSLSKSPQLLGQLMGQAVSELEPERRFELLTCALRVRCSTD